MKVVSEVFKRSSEAVKAVKRLSEHYPQYKFVIQTCLEGFAVVRFRKRR